MCVLYLFLQFGCILQKYTNFANSCSGYVHVRIFRNHFTLFLPSSNVLTIVTEMYVFIKKYLSYTVFAIFVIIGNTCSQNIFKVCPGEREFMYLENVINMYLLLYSSFFKYNKMIYCPYRPRSRRLPAMIYGPAYIRGREIAPTRVCSNNALYNHKGIIIGIGIIRH